MVKIDLTQFNKQLAALNKVAADLPDFALAEFKANTPIRTGNARRNTHLQGTNVVADYAYAQRLEDNHSPQTHGQGMIVPTEHEIQKEVDRRLKGI